MLVLDRIGDFEDFTEAELESCDFFRISFSINEVGLVVVFRLGVAISLLKLVLLLLILLLLIVLLINVLGGLAIFECFPAIRWWMCLKQTIFVVFIATGQSKGYQGFEK